MDQERARAMFQRTFAAETSSRGNQSALPGPSSPATVSNGIVSSVGALMPSRERGQQKLAKAQAAPRLVSSTPKRRKASFEMQLWYAEAARKISITRQAAALEEVPPA